MPRLSDAPPPQPLRSATPSVTEDTRTKTKLPPKTRAKAATKVTEPPPPPAPEGEAQDTLPQPPPEPVKTDDAVAEDRAGALETTRPLTDEDEYKTVLYYGPAGTGKTTAALSMAKIGKGKIFVVDAEGGLKKSALTRQGIPANRIEIWPPKGTRPTFSGLEMMFDAIQADVLKNPGKWTGSVWDSSTELAKTFLDQIMERRGARVGARREAASESDRDDYKQLAKQMRQLLRKFKYLPWHFATTALQREDKDDKTGKLRVGPALSPSVAGDLIGYVDVVLRTEVQRKGATKTYVAHAVGEDGVEAKDRFGALPDTIVNPSFDEIVKLIDNAPPF